MKQPVTPITAIDRPAMAGPIMRAPLKIIEFIEIALGRSSRPTISTTNACRPRAARTITYSTLTRPAQVSAPSTNALIINKVCAPMMSRRRSTWSTTTPANSATSTIGM